MPQNPASQPVYIHLRGGAVTQPVLDAKKLRALFRETCLFLEEKGYFQRAFGYSCIDDGCVAGLEGLSFSNYLLREAFLTIPDPVWAHLDELSDVEALSLHQAVHSVIALPVSGRYHSYGNCGMHYSEFDVAKGQAEYRERANKYLRFFEMGYELLDDGDIVLLSNELPSGLLHSDLPEGLSNTAEDRMNRAIARFRNGLSSWDDREAAVRDLADVLESIRKNVKERLFAQDEKDIFNLLNNFGVRHLNTAQQIDYDRPIFLTWFFYEMLAAIHACQRLANRPRA